MKPFRLTFSHVKTYVMLTLGAAIAGFGIECFLVPNQLAAGGVSGLSTIVHHIFGYPVGTVALIFNIPLFILGTIYEGHMFGVKTLYSTIMLSVFLDLFAYVDPITNDHMLASLYGGVLSGIGLGTVFLAGSTTGGTDITAKLINRKFPWISIGKILLMTDIFIIALATVIFRNLYTGLYSVISLYASSFTIDAMQEGVDFAKTVFIITDKCKEVADVVMKELSRGVTGLYGEGMYTGAKKTVLLCTMKRNEIPKLRKLVIEIDPSAFVITADVREVIGDGFKRI